jgi:hypothetical protein
LQRSGRTAAPDKGWRQGAEVIVSVRTLVKRLQDNEGLWFPRLARGLRWLYQCGLGHQLNQALSKRELGGAWVSEAYQLASMAVAVVWLVLIQIPVLTSGVWMTIGAVVALYRPLEIAVFGLQWLLSTSAKVHSIRRSVAGFILNLIEVGLFCAVAYLVLGSFGPGATTWSVVLTSLAAVFSQELPPELSRDVWTRAIGLFQVAASWLLLVGTISVAIGGISRGEKPKRKKAVERPKEPEPANE